MAAIPAQLERDALTLRDVVFQGITHIAPAANVVFTLPVIAAHAGAAMPLSLLLSAVVCFLIANTVAQFSRYVPSSGGYYTFVSRGLGPRWGFLTTWSYLIYEIVGPAATMGVMGVATAGFLKDGTGIGMPWWVFSLTMIGLVWILTYFSVRLSARTTAVLGGIEILILLVLGVTFLIHPGDGSSLAAPLDPSSAPKKWGVLGGMVFSILALSGFEAPAPLAEESKRPTRFIYLAIFLSLFIVGVFYVFMAYCSAVGWGASKMAGFTNEDSYYTLVRKVWGAGWWIVFLALINCTIALGIAGANAATRVMYTMAMAGTLPAPLKRIHPVHRTPHVAVHVLQVLQIACILVVGVWLGPGLIFPFLGTIGSLAVIVLYLLANVALTLFVWRQHRADFSIWTHGIVPSLATIILIPVIFITVWELPENPFNFSQWAVQKPPFNLAPYCFLGLMLVGLGAMWVLQARRPEALARDTSRIVE